MGISRAELARATGLSKQTTSEAIRGLQEAGWVEDRGQTQGAVGRTATLFQLRPDLGFALGIDLGGTKVHLALANIVGEVVAETLVPIDPRGGTHIPRQIGALATDLLRASKVGPGQLHCAAMACPGILDRETGSVDFAPNIPGLDRIDFAGLMRQALGCPITIENDVNFAAKGEQWLGCGAGMRNFAFVALGTGVGMGLVLNGRLVRGAHGAAGEIAHLPLGADPFDSRGFTFGTFESAVGSAAIVQRYRGFGGTQARDVRGIFDRLEEGDKAAAAAVDETARMLVQGFLAIRAIADPERIILGGSIGIRPELIDRLRALLDKYFDASSLVEPSMLDSRAGLAGALGVALQTAHQERFGITGSLEEFALPHFSGFGKSVCPE